MNTLTSLVGLCAATHPSRFEPCLPSVVTALTHRSDALAASAGLCVASLVLHLGARALVHINVFAPALVSLAQRSLAGNTAWKMLEIKEVKDIKIEKALPVGGMEVAAMSALHVVISTLGSFLGPYVTDILVQLVHPCRTDTNSTHSAAAHARDARKAVAEKIPLRVLFPAVVAAHKSLTEVADLAAMQSIAELLLMLAAAMRLLDREQLTAEYKAIFKFCLVTLDVRSTCNSASVIVAEEAAINLLAALVLRLSESNFRPLYLTLVDWGLQASAPATRRLGFHHGMCSILFFFFVTSFFLVI